MSRSGRDALPDVREWSGRPPGCPEVVGTPSWMSGNGRVALKDLREWSEGPTDVREWSGGPRGFAGVVGRSTGCPGVLGRPSRMSWSDWGALPDVWE